MQFNFCWMNNINYFRKNKKCLVRLPPKPCLYNVAIKSLHDERSIETQNHILNCTLKKNLNEIVSI